MPQSVNRDEVRRLLDEGAQLIEVLPEPEYEWQHLPGALHVPLKDFDVSDLEPTRPVIAYCNDFQ